MIRCGWCDVPTPPGACRSCGRQAAIPWLQRGQEPPAADAKVGRPVLDEKAIRKSWADAKKAVIAAGVNPTLDAIAEKLDRSPRTIREWRVKYRLR